MESSGSGRGGARLFEELEVWIDEARGASMNMAIDELLPAVVAVPVLRFYGWEGPAVSIGYFTPWKVVAGSGFATAGVAVVRRPSGGGLVDHRRGRTFSLAVPAGHPAAGLAPRVLYRSIHAALGEALGSFGLDWALAGEAAAGGSGSAEQSCFAAPVAADLIGADGRKIAGGAQKRSRGGFLHQGHWIAPGGIDERGFEDLAPRFAAGLAVRWTWHRGPGRDLLDAAARRCAELYDRRAWRERR